MLRLLLRLFGSGRLPREAVKVVQVEHCRLIAQQLVGSVTMRNVSAPQRRSSWRRQWFLGSLAVSDKRVLVYRYGTCLLNVQFDDHRLREIDFSAEKSGVVAIVYNLELFQPRSSGEIEISFRTPEAMTVCSAIVAGLQRKRILGSGRSPSR